MSHAAQADQQPAIDLLKGRSLGSPVHPTLVGCAQLRAPTRMSKDVHFSQAHVTAMAVCVWLTEELFSTIDRAGRLVGCSEDPSETQRRFSSVHDPAAQCFLLLKFCLQN